MAPLILIFPSLLKTKKNSFHFLIIDKKKNKNISFVDINCSDPTVGFLSDFALCSSIFNSVTSSKAVCLEYVN